jgi:hypothetical protein
LATVGAIVQEDVTGLQNFGTRILRVSPGTSTWRAWIARR